MTESKLNNNQNDICFEIDNTYVLSCKGLNKTFTEGNLRVEVLTDIELMVMSGERIAIVGASGSGKSTLLHLLGGLDTPTSGKVWVDGVDLSQLNATQRGNLRNLALGFIYQFHHLLPEFTALENVALPLLIRGIDPKNATNQAQEILKQVGLEQRFNHKPGELSGGERQRAAVARALVTQPRCVLADEPTGNLDRATAIKIFDLMLSLNQTFNTSLVVVTHDLNLAKRMDRILTLVEGKLKYD